jgi:peptide/nickel transport system substrate-binding protein
MKKRIIWVTMSCLMALSLVIASCGPAEEEAEVGVGEEEVEVGEGEVEVGEKKVVEEEEVVVSGEPKYGGTLYLLPGLPTYQFDPFLNMFISCGYQWISVEGLIGGDWAKGPAGTGEADFLNSFGGRMELMTGWLAESWDIPDDETMVFHIRPGIHFWDKPPVNGRELTADDVVWCINRAFEVPTSYFYSFTMAGEKPTSVKALDKYTVEVKVKPEVLGMMLLEIGDRLYIYPPEPTEVYGGMHDWQHVCATGAWMLGDFVADSSITYVRNPNYWQYDPIHPENRLPYPDRMVCISFPDASTMQAAFRTGKLDELGMQTYENFELFMQQCPDLEYIQTYPDMPQVLVGRMDKDLPFNDIRVRQALNMAVNKQEIIDDYYDGYADMLSYPVCNAKVFEGIYRPLEEYPESVQMLFEYNPERAKELLTEAGYPDGFKTVVQTSSAGADFLSLLKEYFRVINVDMEIETLEGGAMMGVSMGRTHKEMIMAITKSSVPYFFLTERKEQMDCKCMVDIPGAVEVYEAISRAMGRDDEEVIRIVRDIAPSLLASAWGVWLPVPYTYTMWWPWLHNYYGVQDLGYCNQFAHRTYLWMDEGLKKSMGY